MTVSKPKSITWIPSLTFGVPAGTPGRGAATVLGIMLHCDQGDLSRFDDAAKRTRAQTIARGAPAHPSLHFMLNANGDIHQYVDTANVAWGLDEFTGAFPTPRDISYLTWTEIHDAAVAGSLPPDMYLIHIGVAVGDEVNARIDCNDMPLNAIGKERLVHLITWLAQEYTLDLNDPTIAAHQDVDSLGAGECECMDVAAIVALAKSYCEPDAFPLADRPHENDPLWVRTAKATVCSDEPLRETLTDPLALVGGVLPDGEGALLEYGISKVLGDDLKSHVLPYPFSTVERSSFPARYYGEWAPPGAGPEDPPAWSSFDFEQTVEHNFASINTFTAATRYQNPDEFASYLIAEGNQLFSNANNLRTLVTHINMKVALNCTWAAGVTWYARLYGKAQADDTVPPVDIVNGWTWFDQVGSLEASAATRGEAHMLKGYHLMLTTAAASEVVARVKRWYWKVILYIPTFVKSATNDFNPIAGGVYTTYESSLM